MTDDTADLTVSVVIPVYNGSDFIAESVTSVLSQSHRNLRVTVIDNCSTDDTVVKVKAIDDERLELVQNDTNLGALGNWNKALSFATGDWFKLVCADDVLYPDAIERQLAAALQASDGVAFVAGKRDIIGPSGDVVFSGRGLAGLNGRVNCIDALRTIVRSGTNPFGEPAAVLVRSDAISAVGAWSDDLPYMIDIDMWVKLLAHGDAVALTKTVCGFRLHAASWTSSIGRDQAAQSRAFQRRLAKAAPEITAVDRFRGAATSWLQAQARPLVTRWATRRR